MHNIPELLVRAEAKLAEVFAQLESVCMENSTRVISAFINQGVETRHFSPTTGYGYNDEGKEKLSSLFAEIFGAEAGLVSPHIVSGTHALTLCLFGLLRPLNAMLCVTGTPYDTILPAIGLNAKGDSGSLKDFAVDYEEIDLLPTGEIDLFKMASRLNSNDKIKLLYIQRSRGYAERVSLSCAQIKEAIATAKKISKDIIVLVDNCYGEFCDTLEPSHVGADIVAGSLIKNPGGGLAPSGGYIVGKSRYIDLIAKRLTSPGTGFEVGSNASGYLPYFQGLFMAPHTTLQSLKGAALFAAVFEELGFACQPSYSDSRWCTTQSIRFLSEAKLVAFMRGIQRSSPIDSAYAPTPWDMPGYADKVVMAAGTFISGATSELSADGPIRPPYVAYFQGALTYEHAKFALMRVLAEMGVG